MPGHVNATWGGRFGEAPAELCDLFTGSQEFDRVMFEQDIRGSISHARMLCKQGILTRDEMEQIIHGLKQIRSEIRSGVFQWQPRLEDVHMNIENRLIELIGETGKKLHTGRSRNDQVGLDFRLFISDACHAWQDECINLCRILVGLASKNQAVIMPGFTHLQPAQPVSLAHHLLAYAGMFRRDVERLKDSQKRTRISPLGAAALAGSTYPLDPEMVARELDLNGIYANSMDAVSDRDFVLEALFNGCLIMEHLSRLSEELILWANPAFGYITLPDAYSTGSSIMPQKKNPDVAELIRGKTGRVYGSLMAMLAVMKGLPLAYNKDLQEDKEGFLDTDKTVSSSLMIMGLMLEQIIFQPEKMRAACKRGYLNATELADYLVHKGLPFREAHHITGKIVAAAEQLGLALEDLPLEKLRGFHPYIANDVYGFLEYESCIARRETPGGTGPKSVSKQIRDFVDWLGK